jgi:hypothetical protein
VTTNASLAATAAPALEWSFNPWRERPVVSMVALLTTGASAVFLWSLGLGPLATLALVLALTVNLAPLLVPARCRVDDGGVAHRGALGWERRGWSQIRRVARVRGGLLVSPFEHPRRLDSFRALLLPMPQDQRADLTTAISSRLEHHGLAVA